MENRHTRGQSKIVEADIIPPQWVEDSGLSRVVYVLDTGARWNEVQFEEHWTAACVPKGKYAQASLN